MKTLVPLLLAVALAATACAPNETVLASVDGVPITESDVAALRTSYDDVIPFNEQLRTDLTNLIIQRAALNKLERDFEIEITAADVEAKLASLAPDELAAIEGFRTRPDISGTGSADIAGGCERAFATSFRLDERAGTALASSGLPQLLADDPTAVTQVCVRHVLVATEGEARQVLLRLDQGENFSSVAADVSLDTNTAGGVLPCPLHAAAYVSPFSDATVAAPLGEIFGPVQTDFGFHVLIVDERTTPTLEEVEADPVGTIFAGVLNDRFSSWFAASFEGVDVEVDPRIGTWSDVAFGISPPQG